MVIRRHVILKTFVSVRHAPTYTRTVFNPPPPADEDCGRARLATCRRCRASTSIASIFRPSSEVTIRRNLFSTDDVQLPPLDDDSSDDSEDEDEEEEDGDDVEVTSASPRASSPLVCEPPEDGAISIGSTTVER